MSDPDELAMRAALLVEDEFARHHAGGRTQRLAKIQIIICDAIREAAAVQDRLAALSRRRSLTGWQGKPLEKEPA